MREFCVRLIKGFTFILLCDTSLCYILRAQKLPAVILCLPCARDYVNSFPPPNNPMKYRYCYLCSTDVKMLHRKVKQWALATQCLNPSGLSVKAQLSTTRLQMPHAPSAHLL